MGFQSCSRKMTMSAAVRLSPKPPTCVVSSITGMEGSALKRCTMLKRAEASTLRDRHHSLANAMVWQSCNQQALEDIQG